MARLRIGELLVSANILTSAQVEEALRVQQTTKKRLGDVLVTLGYVDETRLTQGLSQQLSVPWVSLYHVDFSRQLLNLVPKEVAEKYCLVPIYVRRVKKQDTLYVAMDDPTNEIALQEIAAHANIPTKPMIASPSDIRSAIRVYYGGEEPIPPPPASHPEPLPVAPQPLGLSKATVPDVSAARRAALAAIDKHAPTPPPPPPPPSDDHPGAAPEIEAREIQPPARRRLPSAPGMVALTLLDGTTIHLPARKGEGHEPRPADDAYTARDFVSALRAVSHGADASEILGDKPRWEAMFAALLSVMLRKGLIADWEFIEELRRV